MRLGTLDRLFAGVAWKRLTEHEVNPKVSNGHEFQGVARLRELLGEQEREYPAAYVLLSDAETPVVILATAKWYDARAHQTHRSAEWRLYYPAAAGQIQALMRRHDFMIIALTARGELLIVLARAESTSEAELRALFRIGASEERLQLRLFDDSQDVSPLAARILEQVGISPPNPDPVGDGPLVMNLVDELSDKYPHALPSGKEVSQLIHDRLRDVDPVADPDGTLVRWIEAEDTLFRLWEDGLIERRLRLGFSLGDGRMDVQAFRDFSMKLRQSRVSRAGGALQIHTAAILRSNRIRFEAQAVTEHGEKPDFLFPGRAAYLDPAFPDTRLRMLGVKFTAKDRWRQVLNEAARIRHKHLLTLEAPISTSQLRAMQQAQLTILIPAGYHEHFDSEGRALIHTVRAFVEDLRSTDRG